MLDQWKGLNKGTAPEREDIIAWEKTGVALHPETIDLVHDPSALERSFGGNGMCSQTLHRALAKYAQESKTSSRTHWS
jgi:hypothetical protein